MAYAWSWFGLANLTASVLLALLAVLFLRARRSEFTVAFTAFTVIAAASKFAGGMWLYFSADEATAEFWHGILTISWIPLFPTLTHALAAFIWGKRFTELPTAWKAGIYVPFAAFVPLLAVNREDFQTYSYYFGLAYTILFAPFLLLVWRKWRRATTQIERTQSKYVFVWLLIIGSFTAEARSIPVLIEGAPFPHWELAISYVVATSILLYGILKTHLFDIDVKIKFTIKQSTVAAAFIGLFFVVSEGAQAFFSGRAGTYLGIVAAGALVFAIAPLQRFAERVANTAMPNVRPLGEMPADERASMYRELVRSAWADGSLTMDERRMLATARERLGLGDEEAVRLERDVVPG